MQLGELQHQLPRFRRRGVGLIALSVDEPEASLAMIERMGLSFAIASDPLQRVIGAFRVQNPDTGALAIHAVYIVDTEGTIFYRKVGLRRPVSAELIDAVDYYRGEYPQADDAAPAERISVAWPQNDFQALLAVSRVDALPAGVDRVRFDAVLAAARHGDSDDALVAFKALVAESDASEASLLDTAAWLTREHLLVNNSDAIQAGKLLGRRLERIRELEVGLEAALDTDREDELLHTLAKARAGLTVTRSEIEHHAQQWKLRYVKTSLRSRREVVRAAFRVRAAQDAQSG